MRRGYSWLSPPSMPLCLLIYGVSPTRQMLCSLLSIVCRSEHCTAPLSNLNLFFLVATVDHEEEWVPSFFIFYYPTSLSFFYTKIFQCLGDIKIHINKIDHE